MAAALVDSSIETLVRDFEIRNICLNRSPKTIAWYSNNLRVFIEFLTSNGYSSSIEQIGSKQVKEFILYLQNKRRYDGHPFTPQQKDGLSPQTIRAHVETLKAFFSWLHREGYTKENALKNLESPRVPRKVKEVLSQEEVEKLLSHLDRRTPLGCRNFAVLMTLLDTGLRCAELVNLTLGDIHIEQGYLKVMGKGSRERIVPIGSLVQSALTEYVRRFRPVPASPEMENLFLCVDGKPLAVNGVQLMLKRLGHACGVPRLHVHLCRHTFATNYLINGGDVFTLQQILGHSSLEMVRRYITLASGFVAVQHRRFSPLDRMNFKFLKMNPSASRKRAGLSSHRTR